MIRRPFKVLLPLLLSAIFFFPFSGPSAQRGPIDFSREIRPILADKCLACHGPDAATQGIKLRLDSESGALADLGSGRRAIVPNHPNDSLLIKRINSTDASFQMPPPSSGRSLTKNEIDLLRAWIEQGAKFQTHWAFNKPIQRPLPEVRDKGWARNPIDRFILARLEKEGMRPSPEADRATLIRRVTLDLTGLPPTPKEVDDFLNDASPNAYEKVVDRLLASSRYGERMAYLWLDAARYADTNGYQIDGERNMWRWRDWVIEAFNRNMPFDRFVIEQLAGDLLPNPTLDQRIATAFNRNHRTNAEDGIVPEEYAVEYVVDRVDTTSTVFLGLTMGCARCHNHKFDPISQREYYQMYAYFNNIPEDGRASNYGNSAPWVAAPTRAQQKAHDKLSRQIEATKAEIAALTQKYAREFQQWQASQDTLKNTQWFPSDTLLVAHPMDADCKLIVNDIIPRLDPAFPEEENRREIRTVPIGYKDGAPTFVAAPTGQGVQFNGKLYFDAGKTADFNFRDRLRDYKDNFTISVWFNPASEQAGAIVSHMRDNGDAKENNLPKGRGYGLFFNNGKLHFNLTSVWADDSFRVETEASLPLNQWHHAIATFDSTEPFEKVRIYINGQKQKLKINNGRLFRTFGDTEANLRIGGGGGPEWRFRGSIDDVRIYKSLPDEEQVEMLSCADSLQTIAAIVPAKRSRAQERKLRNAWIESAGAPALLKNAWQQMSGLNAKRARLESGFPTIMVMQEMDTPRPAHLLKRGAYDAKGEQVARAVPAVLPPIPKEFPINRLGFARWLFGAENPLTARVIVNRYWQMLFGTGIVKTVEDFGTQGELPSHPELLDWLALEFRNADSGLRIDANRQWNLKALLKTMVTSATYRQSSSRHSESEIRSPQSEDPENRLLARGPRVRLSAGLIRDQALSVSGLLVDKLGGPSVRPYQPDGLWKDMTFSNMTNYRQDHGEGLWRRSLYTFWKRTILAPTMYVFDASAREFCTVRQTRTNTPLQALNLMNDVTYLEAARMLAERMLTEGGPTAEDRVAWAFRLVTARKPNEQEQRLLVNNLDRQLRYFRAYPTEAQALLLIGEKPNRRDLAMADLAAYATTASLILNLDEAITKQ
jgi:hypothetical protein